ncbi:MAG TPA: NAD(P)-binding domain-containing protein [Acidimicrobiia bacterium]|nr:NAD(P)-binding domain-containing protein [Acidimicrobiia bacterium]
MSNEHAERAGSLAVGFLGVGQMGRPMVDRLAATGWAPSVYVRRPDLAVELRGANVAVAESAAALAAAVDVLVVCFFSDAQFREVMLDDGALAAMRPGAIVATHTTGSPDLVLELADRAPDGVRIVDAPVSGTAVDIAAGHLTVLVGGDRADVERVRPVLAAYADPIIEVGALGDAMRVKLVNNLLFTVNLRIALEAGNLAQSLGVAPSDLARALAHCSGDTYALRLLSTGASPEQLEAGVLPYLAKDVSVVREVGAGMGADLGLLGELAGWVDRPEA